MKTKLIALAVLAVVGALEAAEVPLVTVCRVRRGVVFEDTAFAQGTVRTKESATIAARVPGTIDELLMAAEYIMSEGNDNVILCERGIRTFETRTRNTFDLNAVPVLHHLSHLPVVADPSHATGYTRYVEPMALAATACGANGLEIEVHDEPSRAWSDGAQALTPDQFDDTMRRIRAIREVVCQETME